LQSDRNKNPDLFHKCSVTNKLSKIFSQKIPNQFLTTIFKKYWRRRSGMCCWMRKEEERRVLFCLETMNSWGDEKWNVDFVNFHPSRSIIT
jgi:hypothetical protein